MKYCVLIIDGAAGHPLAQHGGKTSLELARTPNLDALARAGMVGLTRTVPEGMEPSSACACMSIIGYDPQKYYKGRSAIEALSMGIDIGQGESVFRCNLVAVRDGKMFDYSAGHITTQEARELITDIDQKLGDASTRFYPGVSYRHILKLKGHEESEEAVCTPPHDIPGKPIAEFLPRGIGSAILKDLMQRSEPVLANHPVNLARRSRGETPATTIWLFWASGQVPALPSFQEEYGVRSAMISGVDLLRGLAKMVKMEIVTVPGVTYGQDNDYSAQALGAMKTLEEQDLVVIHVEAPDEAGHSGSLEGKVEAIEKTDQEIIRRLREYRADKLRLLIMPDHPTPIEIQTHTGEPVPFVLSGPGFKSNGARRLTEAEALSTDFRVETGYVMINKLIRGLK
jgi:2,3-bisphosphoglycerate-independent phosphoglycerate mutase